MFVKLGADQRYVDQDILVPAAEPGFCSHHLPTGRQVAENFLLVAG